MEREYLTVDRQRGPRAGVSAHAVNHSNRQELDIKIHGVNPELALGSCDTVDQAEEMEAQGCCCCLLRPFT